MNAHRIETTLKQDGTLILSGLPFHAGESVEVIILNREVAPRQEAPSRYPLRGTHIEYYDNPTEPIAQEDWDVLR